MTTKPIIEVKDLKKSFGTLQVLKGINTEVQKGEVVVVIGPSGSGKSTFLRCLNLLETPTAGSIYVDGAEITTPSAISTCTGRRWAWCSSTLTCSII